MSQVFHLNIYFKTKVKLNPEFFFFQDFCIKKFLKKQNTFDHGINVAYCFDSSYMLSVLKLFGSQMKIMLCVMWKAQGHSKEVIKKTYAKHLNEDLCYGQQLINADMRQGAIKVLQRRMNVS